MEERTQDHNGNGRIQAESVQLQPEPGRGPLRDGVERVVDWGAVALPQREWLVEGWLPAGRIGMFSGPDGGGKSILIMQLAAAMARGGGPWLERGGAADPAMPEAAPGPVVFASWEDEISQGRLWLEWIARGQDLQGAKLISALGDPLRLQFLDLSRRGPVWGSLPGQAAGLLEAGHLARREVEKIGARLLVMDSLGYCYGGDENENAGVAQFMADFDGWGRDTGCAVMLVHHPGKAPYGQAQTGYRGASSWQAHARWRWELHPARAAQGAESDKKPPCLSCEKASYAMQPKAISLQERGPGQLTWRESGDQSSESDETDYGE